MIKNITPLDNIPIRFFVYDEEIYDEQNDYHGDIVECDEATFLEAKGEIQYERDTVFANGVKQICLTKMPKF